MTALAVRLTEEPLPVLEIEVLLTGVGAVILGVEQDDAMRKAEASPLRTGKFVVVRVTELVFEAGMAGGLMCVTETIQE